MTKILLVEDDKSLREIYGVRLLAEGYDIISAGDGEAALAMAIKDRPSLIVSDVMMPKISGFDMLDILRSTTETKDIKVIMMTALSSDDQRKRGEQLGADKYLVKSQVGIEDVVRAVHEVLGDAPLPNGGGFPQPAPTTTPAPQPPAPVASNAPSPTSQVTAPPVPAAVPAPAPSPSMASPAASDSTLPQPTAPFSTPRPGGLAARVIQPIERSEPAATVIADQIEKELGGMSEEPSALVPPVSQPQPAAPAPAPAPQPPAPVPSDTPEPATISQAPSAETTPQPQQSEIPAPQPTPPTISYEETPPATPQQTT